MRPTAPALAALLCVLPLTAHALEQPDGTPIPQGSGLQGLFDSRGEGINALTNARILPDRFVPSCALTFTVLQRNAGYQNSFGWYNVTGKKPEGADLHEFLGCTDKVGAVKSLDIRADPAYAGGEIGFFEGVNDCASPGNYLYVFYTERQYNPDSVGANPFVHLLIYDSKVIPKAFYFGWEDLVSGGDNDFDDLTTLVEGITCSGGGAACSTGQPGMCASGVLQCRNGALACEPVMKSAAEKCDGLDNDCNGTVDEGSLCGAGEICDQGRCVPRCSGGEIPCNLGEVCVSDVCLPLVCAEVKCDGGKRCVQGKCVAPCDGVTCPAGRVCRVGVCVDPCAGITCDTNYLCAEGVCRIRCGCEGCPTGQTCGTDGRCVLDACVGKTCPAGQHCGAGGACVDSCAGATCPAGQVCKVGECVAAPPGPDAGAPGPDAAGGDEGDAGGSSTKSDAGRRDAGSITDGTTSGSCGCSAAPSGALFALVGLLGFVRRRR